MSKGKGGKLLLESSGWGYRCPLCLVLIFTGLLVPKAPDCPTASQRKASYKAGVFLGLQSRSQIRSN